MPERAWKLLRGIAELYRSVLHENLVGIYAHGSLAFGCFRWEVSDIDFLVVVQKKPTQYEKQRMIQALLERSGGAPPKGFEMSVVLKKDLSPFVYPTPFELHFSNAHLDAYREDMAGYCAGMNGTDPDLAAHCMVVRTVGQTVYGVPIGDVFGEVPLNAYLDSIWLDVKDAEEETSENLVYMTLNLCRVLAAVQSGRVLSKADGGQWALDHLDAEWRCVITAALDTYRADRINAIDKSQAKAFAAWAVGEIAAEKDQSLQ